MNIYVQDEGLKWFKFERDGYNGIIDLSKVVAIVEEEEDKVNVYLDGDGMSYFSLSYSDGLQLLSALGLGGAFDE